MIIATRPWVNVVLVCVLECAAAAIADAQPAAPSAQPAAVPSAAGAPAAAVPQPVAELLLDVHDRAALARQAQDWPEVERLRRKREEILGSSADEGSPWVRGSRAILAVVGEGAESPGLVNRLSYQEAGRVLVEAWKPFAASSEGPVYGDLAVRLFKVTQQALAVDPSALADNGAGSIVSHESLVEMLDTAIRRDPCQVEAMVIRAALTNPDPAETLLRDEFRGSLEGLLRGPVAALAHREGAAIMPWHGPAGFLKAVRLGDIAEERSPIRLLRPDTIVDGIPRPGHRIAGVDARYRPFQIILGRCLLMEVPDAAGTMAPAIIHLDPQGVWQKHHVRLVYRFPLPEERGEARTAYFESLFRSLPPVREWRLGRHSFGLFDLPIAECDALIARGVRQIVVENAIDLTDPAWSPTGNSPSFLVSKLTVDGFRTHPAVEASIRQFQQYGNRQEHALINLTTQPVMMGTVPTDSGQPQPAAAGPPDFAFNPLIVISGEDNGPVEMQFFTESAEIARSDGPYLLVNDEKTGTSRLVFKADSREFVINFPGFDAHLPLTANAIPRSLLVATEAGKVLERVLLEAGYSEVEADREVRLALDDPTYQPEKVIALLKARQQSFRKASRQQISLAAVAAQFFTGNGWKAQMPPGKDLFDKFESYGFRYFTDSRGHVILNRDLTLPPEPVDPVSRFEIIVQSADGRTRIDPTQFFTLADYDAIEQRLATTLFPEALGLSPVVPALREALAVGLPAGGPGPAGSVSPQAFEPWQLGQDLEEISDPEARDKVTKRVADINGLFAAYARLSIEGLVNSDRREPVLSLQVADARDAALERAFHRSLVFYGDAIGLHRLRLRDDVIAIRAGIAPVVAEPQVEAFVAALERLLSDAVTGLVMQIEQALVLKAAGRGELSDDVLRRLLAQVRYSVVPAAQMAFASIKTYGRQPSPEAQRLLKRLEGFAAGLEQFAGRRIDDAHLAKALEPGPDDAEVIEKVRAIRERIAKADPSVALDRQGIARALEEIAFKQMSLPIWAGVRSLQAAHARQTLTSASYEAAEMVSPMLFMPRLYDPSAGFTATPARLLPDGIHRRLAEWAKLPADDRGQAADGAANLVLVAWYWADTYLAHGRGHPECIDYATRALVEATERFSAAADETRDGMVSRLNMITSLAGAIALWKPPIALMATSNDFIEGLSGQLTMWERRWVSKGYDTSHAGLERQELAELLAVLERRQRFGGREALQVSNRLYFPDYDFFAGPIPDKLVRDFLKKRIHEDLPRNAEGAPVDPAAEAPVRTGPLGFEEFMVLSYPKPEKVDPEIVRLARDAGGPAGASEEPAAEGVDQQAAAAASAKD